MASGRFLASIPWMSILSTEPRKGFLLLAPGTKDDASVPERKFRTCGASGVAAYIVAARMAAGDKSDKKEVCRGRGTRPKLMGAVKHPAETWVADASSSLPGGRYPSGQDSIKIRGKNYDHV